MNKIFSVAALCGLVALLPLAACGQQASPSSPSPTPSARETIEAAGHSPRLAITYDGGVQVIDATRGEVLGDFPTEGYTRLSQAGDQRHLLLTEGDHFRLLDMGTWSKTHGDHYHAHKTSPLLTDTTFDGKHPGHAVVHDERTALFYDGEGRIEVFEPTALSVQKPQTRQIHLPKAHHGVAVVRADDTVVHTVGDENSRSGIQISDASGRKIAANNDCPGVHGEGAYKDALTFGCENGMLIVKGNTITRVKAPDAYGRIGNQAPSEHSPIAFGDYKVDKKAELERPTRVSLVDTRTGKLKLVETGASYSFRSLGRSTDGDALLLGTDGRLRVIDENSGKITKQVPVTKAWSEPTDWHAARPTLFVNGEDVWVSEPSTKKLHLVDLDAGRITRSIQLDKVPDELNGVKG